MTLLTADRGQALQVGAVLLFGILVILFTVWQAFVIPDQNERVEFSHNQEVQSEMVELRGNIVSTADATTPSSGSVKLGAQFPTRLLFVNPSPAAGTLRTESVGEEEFLIENATAAVNGTGESLYWNGTNRTYETVSLKYSPDYRVFQGAPTTVYDNTVTYNTFDREQNSSALSEQAIIDGDTITLIAFVGEYSESGIVSVTPDITPVSTRTRSVAIEDTNGPDENVTLRLPTRLNASQWEQLLNEEFFDPDTGAGSVHEVRNGTDDETVVIELVEGQYELRMAQVGVGEGLVKPRPAYIEAVEGANEDISPFQNHSITVEVRDRFNAPQNNVNISASVAASKGEVRPANQTTNVDGQATFEYEPDDSLSDGEEVNITFNETLPGTFANQGIPETNVTVTIDRSAGGGDDDETFNPNQIRVNSATSSDPIEIEFNNTANGSQNWSEIRIPFVSAQGGGNPPDQADILFPNASSGDISDHDVGSGFEDIDPDLEFEAQEPENVNLREVEVNFSGGGSVDFFIVSVVADDGIIANYFVAPS